MKTQTIDLNQRLTEHFTLREMVVSGTAIRLNIDNMPSDDIVERLRALCDNVLEPLRRRFGVIRVTSGYRSEALNKAVGGVSNSQHMKGEAADVHVTSLTQAQMMMNYVERYLDFDQLLLERVMKNGCCWIHVSYVTQQLSNRTNRRMAREVRLRS